MGLDISYYGKLTPAPDAPRDEYDEVDYRQFCTFNEDGLQRRGADLKPGVYSFEKSESFGAGSYSGYNAWRDELAKFAGYGTARDVWQHSEELAGKPFVELIDFSDCEGTIGPSVAAKLAADFAAHQERADTFGDEWWRSLYAEWRKAFEVAAQAGAVDFH